MTIGERIQKARKNAGLTQRQLGEKLGVSYQAVAQWENNLRNPKKETIKKIAIALNVRRYELYPEDQQGQAIIDTFLDDFGVKRHAKERINEALDKLTEEGMEEAAKRVEELTEIPKYQKSPSEDNQGNGDQE